MKKTIALVLILVLIVCLFAGCRKGSTGESMATDASRMIDDMMPRSDNAHPTDGDGFIGNGSGSNNMPGSNGNNTGRNGNGNGNMPGSNGNGMPGM